MCNLLQYLELEVWPNEDSEELKYEVIECERSPMIGTVSAEESKGESVQAGPSSQENSLGDRLKFQGIYHRDERHDCKDRDFGQYEKVTLRQRSKAHQRGIPLRRLRRRPNRRRPLGHLCLLERHHLYLGEDVRVDGRRDSSDCKRGVAAIGI